MLILEVLNYGTTWRVLGMATLLVVEGEKT